MDLANSQALVSQARKQPVALEMLARTLGPLERQRLAIWIGAGLAGGLALATLSPRQWSRLGALVFGAGAWLLRSPIGPALLAAVLARATADSNADRVINVEVVPAPTAS